MRPYVMEDMVLHGEATKAEEDVIIVEQNSTSTEVLMKIIKKEPGLHDNNNDDTVDAERVIYDFRVGYLLLLFVL